MLSDATSLCADDLPCTTTLSYPEAHGWRLPRAAALLQQASSFLSYIPTSVISCKKIETEPSAGEVLRENFRLRKYSHPLVVEHHQSPRASSSEPPASHLSCVSPVPPHEPFLSCQEISNYDSNVRYIEQPYIPIIKSNLQQKLGPELCFTSSSSDSTLTPVVRCSRSRTGSVGKQISYTQRNRSSVNAPLYPRYYTSRSTPDKKKKIAHYKSSSSNPDIIDSRLHHQGSPPNKASSEAIPSFFGSLVVSEGDNNKSLSTINISAASYPTISFCSDNLKQEPPQQQESSSPPPSAVLSHLSPFADESTTTNAVILVGTKGVQVPRLNIATNLGAFCGQQLGQLGQQLGDSRQSTNDISFIKRNSAVLSARSTSPSYPTSLSGTLSYSARSVGGYIQTKRYCGVMMPDTHCTNNATGAIQDQSGLNALRTPQDDLNIIFNNPSTKPSNAHTLVDLLISLGVEWVATDFDLTMTSQHSGGHIDFHRQTKPQIFKSVTQDFCRFAEKATERGLKLSVVTFADEVTATDYHKHYRQPDQSECLAGESLVRKVISECCPHVPFKSIHAYYPPNYVTINRWKALGLTGPMPKSKSFHLKQLQRLRQREQPELLRGVMQHHNSKIILIDDDIHNCQEAIREGYLALKVTGRAGFAFHKLASV